MKPTFSALRERGVKTLFSLLPKAPPDSHINLFPRYAISGESNGYKWSFNSRPNTSFLSEPKLDAIVGVGMGEICTLNVYRTAENWATW